MKENIMKKKQSQNQTILFVSIALVALLAVAGATAAVITMNDKPVENRVVYQQTSSAQQQLPACDDDNIVGKVAGGLAGGLLGTQVGGGRGKTAATIGGSVGGTVLGEKYIPTKNVTCR
jgi:uncharacterized protein YcfJ